MIILDTNVLAEVLRPTPDPRVIDWLAAQPQSALFTTTITRGELFYGIKLLPDGQRRRNLQEAVQALFDQDLAGRVLSFDNDAADSYADIAISRRQAGNPVSQSDAMIAGIVRSRGARLATRNVKDFTGSGIEIVDPWQP